MNDSYPTVLDACCGTRAMWFDKKDDRAIFVDCRSTEIHVAPGRAYKNGAVLTVAPDIEVDFTAMPFADETFSHVVFDPPHHTSKRFGKAGTGVMEAKYGRLLDGWEAVIQSGFSECFRVLKNECTLIFKWCSVEIPLRKVLALTPEKPLYGHRSGKRSQTHWVAFLKQPGSAVSNERRSQAGQLTIDYQQPRPGQYTDDFDPVNNELDREFMDIVGLTHGEKGGDNVLNQS